MKVLLIHPNKFSQRYVSVGCGMISAALKAAGHQVEYFDTSRFRDDCACPNAATMSKQKKVMEEVLQFKPVELPPIEKSDESVSCALESIMNEYKPDLICISTNSSEFNYAVSIIDQIRRHNIPIIVGGPHSTVAPDEVLAVEGVDMACVGEGEEAIVELVESLSNGKPRSDIRNIYFKQNGKIVRNALRAYSDLDSLPFMDLDIFDDHHHIGAYQGRVVKYGRFETARGCPYKCTYCVNEMLHNLYDHENRHVRYKSAVRIIEELKQGLEKIGFDIIRFVDETFTASPIGRLEEFVKLYKQEINKPLIIATRPEGASYKVMSILREAHDDIQVTMGIESGSERIRKEVLNRSMSDETIIKAYRTCNDLGFSTASFNMIGLPGETRSDFMKTIELNAKAEVHTPMLSYFYPFKGCRLRQKCIENSYIEDRNYEVDYSVSSKLKMPEFTVDEIEGLKRTFVMYVKMDRSKWNQIEKAERNDEVFSELVRAYKQNDAGVNSKKGVCEGSALL